jgi:two-component system, response regulator YesN
MFRILLVDDEPIVRLTVSSLGDWRNYGFEIAYESADGADALENFKLLHNFDIILTDISMPKLNGIELIKSIREIDKNIPIIVLSAYNDYQYVRDAFKLGVHDYI